MAKSQHEQKGRSGGWGLRRETLIDTGRNTKRTQGQNAALKPGGDSQCNGSPKRGRAQFTFLKQLFKMLDMEKSLAGDRNHLFL